MSTAGPYAFMDVFDFDHVCNHTDETGRYAYKVNYPPRLSDEVAHTLD
jgi:uncharacterized protein YdiU (UPF0061 family)